MIHFFCALPCEAEPLIQHYQMTQQKKHKLFRLFLTDDGAYSLTITGVGKLNAAAAVSYHNACLQTASSDIWLNIGVAGHHALPATSACLVNKISAAPSGQTWYPQLVTATPCQSMPLITLDAPSDNYQDALFDMEAAGFYAIAIRLGTAELVHCFKVVSDNRKQHFKTVKASDVRQYIEAQLPQLDQFLAALGPLAEELRQINQSPADFETFTQQWHFTQTEKRQLEQLLRQWQLRQPGSSALDLSSKQDSGKAVIQVLRQALQTAPFDINSDRGCQ